ncbi:MAG TPA: calcium-binding protein [Allosphingosinicella sp.]|jgi:Ca2+-binding RTX toxin-like protein
MPTFTGTDQSETIEGTEFGDDIAGGGGNDTVLARGGPDIIRYQRRWDRDDGHDQVDGGAGTDEIIFSSGYQAYASNNNGYQGPETYYLSASSEGMVNLRVERPSTIYGYYDNTTSRPAVTTISVRQLFDAVNVERVSFIFSDETPPPTLNVGFSGFRHYRADDRVVISNLSGSQMTGLITFYGGYGNDFLDASLAHNQIFAQGGTHNDTLIGGHSNDVLEGGDGDDVLDGRFGDDALRGGAGNDRLIGLSGVNTMEGGAGNDTYVVENANNMIAEAANGGEDTIETSTASWTLQANIEHLRYTGTGSFEGIGNELNNSISGGDAGDRLAGRGGNNVLDGVGGYDFVDYTGATRGVVVDLGADGASDNGFGGSDTLIRIENVIGSSYGDLIYGGDEANRIEGRAGNDVLYGLDGNDFLLGEAGDDILNGGAGDDTLAGGIGSNILTGGTGNDWYIVGYGNDTIIENAGEGNADRVFAGAS